LAGLSAGGVDFGAIIERIQVREVKKRILLASPRGFCLGVDRGVKILESAINNEKGVVYVRKEIVHNVPLINYFKARGAVFVKEVDEIPNGCAVVFSTHGVAPSAREKAAARNLKVIDATCPLVTKIHEEAVKFKNHGYAIVLIGIPNHPEIIGTYMQAPDNTHVIQDENDFGKLDGIDGSRVAWLSQTTLDADVTKRIAGRLREKFPALKDPPRDCICRATKERQAAVKAIAGECDLFVAVGSEKSSNTRRLAEIARKSGAKRVVRVDTPEELDGMDFSFVNTIGITSGASVEEKQVRGVVSRLAGVGFNRAEERVLGEITATADGEI
jgi:4-hydroxy-3-methylbut-2-enyl diphosphate reductase